MKSADEITQALRQAVQLLETADIPKELHSVAFGKVFDVLVDEVPGVSKPGNSARESKSPAPTGLTATVATQLGVDRQIVEDLFEEQDGELNLTVPRAKLDPHKSRGTKQISLLLTAGRQAAGIEEWTEARLIREVADDYGKLDAPNFAAAVAELGDYLKIAGSGIARKVKVRKGGFEEAAALMGRLAGGQ